MLIASVTAAGGATHPDHAGSAPAAELRASQTSPKLVIGRDALSRR